MGFFPCLCHVALLVVGFAFTSWSAPIPYPNQVFSFSGGTFAPVAGASDVKAMAVEGERGMAVRRDGSVLTWGFPEHWLTNSFLEGITNAVAVGLSYTMAAVLTEDGRMLDLERADPERPPITNAIAIDVCGQFDDDDLDFRLAVTSDGRVVARPRYDGWSPNSFDIPGVVSAAGGWSHIVALKTDGTVVEWDVDTLPADVAGLSNVVAVAAGGEHSVALKADGTVVAWGQNYYGQLNVPSGLSNVVAITAAEDHTLALKSDGTLAAWGRAYLGGEVDPPAGLSNVVAIASSGTHNLALVGIPSRQPLLAIAAATNAQRLIITLSGDPGGVYTIESSSDLRSWHFIQQVASEAGSVSFEVGNTNSTGQFFRAR